MELQPDLTVEERAALLRVHPETVRHWLRVGDFPNAYRRSRRSGWRVPRSDVEAFRRRNVVKDSNELASERQQRLSQFADRQRIHSVGVAEGLRRQHAARLNRPMFASGDVGHICTDILWGASWVAFVEQRPEEDLAEVRSCLLAAYVNDLNSVDEEDSTRERMIEVHATTRNYILEALDHLAEMEEEDLQNWDSLLHPPSSETP